jgi:hypothetical protein
MYLYGFGCNALYNVYFLNVSVSGKHDSSHLHGDWLESFMDRYVSYVWKEGVSMTALCRKLDVDRLEAEEK